MYKVYCKLDEDKVNGEGIYSLSEMLTALDEMAQKCGLNKEDDGRYVGEGENSKQLLQIINLKGEGCHGY